MLLAQITFHFISEHYLIIIISLLIIFLILRSQDNERRGILFVLFFLVLIGYFFYWRSLCRNQENIQPQTFIVYDVGLSPEQVSYFEDTLHYKKIKECKTNPKLQLWSLQDNPSSDIIGSDGLADGGDGKVKGGSGGDEDLINVSRNLIIRVPKTIIPSNLNLTSKDRLSHKTYPKNIGVDTLMGDDYIIALTDNGIDNRFDYPNLWNIPNGRSLVGLGELRNGWNCQKNNSDIYLQNSHGTLVTYLMERELKSTPHKILPFVILDENKEGLLFDALCAFEYVIAINDTIYNKATKIRAINASWGFYGFENEALKHGIEKLKQKNILLVTAAGNSDEKCDKCEELEPNNIRNLSLRKKKFYPACYSKEFENVISVTSLMVNGDLFQSPNQNYSDEFVDIGVQSDNYRTGDFLFPFAKKYSEVYTYGNGINQEISFSRQYNEKYAFWGSSFAAPIATAEIFSRKLLKPQTVQSDGTFRYVLDTKNILLTKDVVQTDQEQATSNYRIESTWRATNLTKNGKVLLKKY